MRLGFVLFGAMNPKDWRTISLEDIDFDPQEIEYSLLPVLRTKTLDGIEDKDGWTSKMVGECREALKIVMPFTDSEHEFLDRLLDRGEIHPELLTPASAIQEKDSIASASPVESHQCPLYPKQRMSVSSYVQM